jgi:hypothetical protein
MQCVNRVDFSDFGAAYRDVNQSLSVDFFSKLLWPIDGRTARSVDSAIGQKLRFDLDQGEWSL